MTKKKHKEPPMIFTKWITRAEAEKVLPNSFKEPGKVYEVAKDGLPEENCNCYVGHLPYSFAGYLAQYRTVFNAFILNDRNSREIPIAVTHYVILPEFPIGES